MDISVETIQYVGLFGNAKVAMRTPSQMSELQTNLITKIALAKKSRVPRDQYIVPWVAGREGGGPSRAY